jgi:DNA-binding CsgD family transcriptional regulator
MMMRSEADEAYLASVNSLQTITEKQKIQTWLTALAEKFDFKSVAYFASNVPQLASEHPYLVVTYSDEWVNHYKLENYESIDPVLAKGFSSLLPIDWDQLDRSSNKCRKLFGEASEHGIGSQGLTIPIRGRMEERALFSITKNTSRRNWESDVGWMMRDFQSIAHHFHQMILKNEGVKLAEISLAPREVDCLRWVAGGKTSSEIAIILSLSPRTVEYYVNSAKTKLGVTNITQAVTKAMAQSSFYQLHKSP